MHLRPIIMLTLFLATDAIASAQEQAERANADDKKELSIEVCGNVIDADSGKPVNDFRVMVGSPYNEIHTTWQPHLVTKHAAGEFVWKVDRAWRRTRLRIVADGYRPGISPLLRQGAGKLSMTFRLRKDDGFRGVVMDQNGDPVSDAEVALATQTFETQVINGRLRYLNGKQLGATIDRTDNKGRFRLPPESDPYLIVACHPKSGYAVMESSQTKRDKSSDLSIRLRPWCRVTGVSTDKEGVPIANTNYAFSIGRQPKPEWPVLKHRSTARTNGNGEFDCPHLAEGQHLLLRWYVNERGALSFDNSYEVTAISGETLRLNVGQQVRPVVGQFQDVSEALPFDFDWSQITGTLVESKKREKVADITIVDGGLFHAPNVAPGRYRVKLVAQPGTPEAGWAISSSRELVVPLVDKSVADLVHHVGDVELTVHPTVRSDPAP